jgi:hypothetical protein
MFGVVYKVIQKVVITKHNLINYIYLQIYYRVYIYIVYIYFHCMYIYIYMYSSGRVAQSV